MQLIDLNSGPLARAWRDNTIGALYELAKRAPGMPLALRIGGVEVLLFQDAAAARHMLRDSVGNYAKNYGGFHGLFGESRFTSEGQPWEQRRDLSQSYITSAKPAVVLESANRAFAAAVEEMLESRDGSSSLDIDTPVNRAAATVISEVALGFQNFDIDETIRDFREILRFGSRRNWAIGGAPVRETAEDRQTFENAKLSLGERIRDAIAAADREEGGGLILDIAAAEADGIDPVGEISSLLFAGFDTTATAISWGLFLLAASPDLQAHLRAAVRRVTDGRPPSVADLEALPELAAFRNEVLRIFPPIPALGRTPLADDRIGEVAVRAGQPVMLSIIGMHHDPHHFPQPAQVRLKRYPPGQLGAENVGHHLPFSDGRRVCAGSRIANAEMMAAIAILIDKLQFELADMRPLEFEWVASLRRRGGQNLRISPA